MRLRRVRRARTPRLPIAQHVQSDSSMIRQASGRARDAPETSGTCPRSPATSYGSRSSAIVMPEAKALRGLRYRGVAPRSAGFISWTILLTFFCWISGSELAGCLATFSHTAALRANQFSMHCRATKSHAWHLEKIAHRHLWRTHYMVGIPVAYGSLPGYLPRDP